MGYTSARRIEAQSFQGKRLASKATDGTGTRLVRADRRKHRARLEASARLHSVRRDRAAEHQIDDRRRGAATRSLCSRLGSYSILQIDRLHFEWKYDVPTFLAFLFRDEDYASPLPRREPDAEQDQYRRHVGYHTTVDQARRRLEDVGLTLEFFAGVYDTLARPPSMPRSWIRSVLARPWANTFRSLRHETGARSSWQRQRTWD